MSITERIEQKITQALSPEQLDVIDDSAKHQGHGGWREGGETHFRVVVVSQLFEGMTRVARQQKIYQLLAEEMAERVHALQLKCVTPAEAAKTLGEKSD
ncbi:BolA family protein [Rhodovibrionaceae bacterium A322]